MSTAVVSTDLQITFGAGAASIALLSSVYFYAYSIMQLLAVGNLGALSAAGPLALMSGALGWQQVFIILGVITIVLAVLAWIITRDHPSDMNLPSIQEIEAEEMREPVPDAKMMEKIPMGKALKMTFGAGMKFWPLAIWFFLMYGSIMVYQGLWAGPFYHDILGWDKATYGLVLTFIGIGMIFGCPTAGYISDKILRSRKKVLIIGTVVYTITLIYFPSQAALYCSRSPVLC